MTFSGFLKSDLVNYPGKIASTVFTCGCNFRCPYCHNPEFVINGSDETYFGETYTEEDILEHLKKRKGFLEALVVSGGEPTLHVGLAPFLRKVKELGLAVKLDTNGSRPDVLRDLVNAGLLDYVAMDIKAPLEKYELFGFNDTEAIKRSVEFLRNSVIDYEFRTTCPRKLLQDEDFQKMALLVGVRARWCLQTFNPSKTLDPAYNNIASYSHERLSEIALSLGMPNIVVR
jgi:pyruvate formate lyase activating enzyme